MINGKTVLAVIPARGGSKRLPRKNVLPLAAKPLIVWTIEAGLKSRCIDSVVISSDDEEIHKISIDAGAEIIQRPQELATDKASSFSAIEHVINEINGHYDYTALLQPTSPFRNNKHIDEAFDLLLAKDADAVISVCETEYSPLWTNILPDDGRMDNFLRNEVINTRSQDLPVYYRLNGAIFICKTTKLMDEKTFFIKDNIFAYKMTRKCSIDIDDEFDWHCAESLIPGK